MKCLISVDHAARLVTTTWRGVIDVEDIEDTCRRRSELGAHSYPQLIDAVHAEIARLPGDAVAIPREIPQLAALSQKLGPAGPTAVVVHAQVDFGMCRMVAAYFITAGKIAVFYQEAEARAWLRDPANQLEATEIRVPGVIA